MKKALIFILCALLCVQFACGTDRSVLNIMWADSGARQEINSCYTVLVNQESICPNRISSMLSVLVGEDYKLCSNYINSKQKWKDLQNKIESDDPTLFVTKDVIELINESYLHAPDRPSYESIMLDKCPKGKLLVLDILGKSGNIGRAFVTIEGNSFTYYRYEDTTIVEKSMCEYNLLNCESEDEKEEILWLMPDPKTALEDSLSIALQCIHEFNIPLDLLYYEPCTIITDYINRSDGWTFVFTKQNNGLFAQIKDGQWYYINPDSPPCAGSPWGQEFCSITVDQGGVCAFSWTGASTELKRISSSSIMLKNNTEIKPIIEKQLTEIYKDHINGKGSHLSIQVVSVNAGLSLISVDENSKIGQYVPSWYVDYRYKWSDAEDIPGNWEQGQIIFNAINGNYIEPRITQDKLNRIINCT